MQEKNVDLPIRAAPTRCTGQVESVEIDQIRDPIHDLYMIPRRALDTARSWAAIFRVVAIVGPRQSGKTTLARLAFPDHAYRTLEDPDQRDLALADPRGFLAALGDGAIPDEVQRCPDLLPYLQGIVDADPRPGRWVLTGSVHLHRSRG